MAEGERPAARPRPGRSGNRQSSRGWRRLLRPSVAVLVLGLAVTALLSALCYVVNERAESRLLDLETKQVAATFEVAVSALQTPLTSAAEIAEASNGDPARFRRYVAATLVRRGSSLASASLWRLEGTTARPVTSAGKRGPAVTPGLVAFVRSAIGAKTALQVSGHLSGDHPSLWYAVTATTTAPHYAVFAVAPLPRNRMTQPQSPGAAFSELNFALYLGRTTQSSKLLASDVGSAPLRGRTATTTVKFGSSTLTIVATPAQRLSGTLSAWMWWLVAIFGGCATVGAAVTAEWLVRRRETAEALRSQVEELLAEQRGISESLQRALLPQTLPKVAGADVAARYVPGTEGTEVGGDWYDVLPQASDRLFFVIGDVSGRGIRAATVMASLRFAIRGFVSEGHSPSTVLAATSRLLDLRTDRHFATVLCGTADLRSRQLTIASAGHLLPLLVTQDGASLVRARVAPPIGIAPPDGYPSTTIGLPPAGMLLLFTDGLVERRGEDLDQGLARLLDAVRVDGRRIDEQLDTLIATLLPERAADDTAVVGVRWT